MKPEEIRKKSDEVNSALKTLSTIEQGAIIINAGALDALVELAAQVAEANESLKYIAHPLMEVQSAEQAAGEKTLRDEFAMAALQGLMMANYQDCPFPGGYAEEAYKVADSMLEARKK